jgi:hypothetical protein
MRKGVDRVVRAVSTAGGRAGTELQTVLNTEEKRAA